MNEALRTIITNPTVRKVARQVTVLIASEVIRTFGNGNRRKIA